MNEEEIEVDFDDLVNAVSKQTGVDQELVEKVLNAESDYLKDKGILEEF